MFQFLSTHTNSAPLTQITYTTNNPQAAGISFEEETELSYKGNMYDVVKKETHETTTTLYCVADEKETALVQSYLRLDTQTQPGKETLVGLKLLLSIPCLVPAKTDAPVVTRHTLKHTTYFINRFPVFVTDVNTPPPRSV